MNDHATMFDEWFYRNYHANRDKIKKFWDERPKRYKLCPNCQKIFKEDGHPMPGSWSCSEWCFDATNMRHPVIHQDTISRLYLLDLNKELFKDVS